MQGKRINLYILLVTYLPTYLLFRSSKQARAFNPNHPYKQELKDKFTDEYLRKHVLPDATYNDWQDRIARIRRRELGTQAKLELEEEIQQYIYKSRP